MTHTFKTLLLCCLGALAIGDVNGQTDPDSLRSYDLAEIVVQDGSAETTLPTTVQRIALAALARQDGAAIAQVARLIPSAHTQTNSRGETLLYLRNAGERQVAIFFDGALLNIPWDNRVDLSFIPSSLVGRMTVSKGASSILYGTNVLGGALNMTSRTLGDPGVFTEVSVLGGTQGSRQGLLTHLAHRGPVHFSGALGFRTHDGLAIPSAASLPYSQAEAAFRTNTDQRLLNGFAQASYQIEGGGEVGLALLHVSGEKGVAPESHLNPTVSRVRFWRYPQWSYRMLILNGSLPLRPSLHLRAALWGSRFTQAIDQYASAAYARRTERQNDTDLTAGARLALIKDRRAGQVRLSLNALTSQHEQWDEVYETNTPFQSQPLFYQQHILSTGIEYDGRIGTDWRYVIGGSIDAIATPKTGDKPGRAPLAATGLTSGIRYALSETWAVKASAGRKVRFATMRELFGEALNTFLLNPNLKPETSWMGEGGVTFASETLSGEALFFASRTFDTIDQRRVTVDGVRLRQRINLEGSRIYGIEVVGAATPLPPLKIEGHLTWSAAEGLESDGSTRRLTEKPDLLATLTGTYRFPWGMSMLLQGIYTGRAYGLAEDNTLTPLPKALRLNARLAYRHLFVGRFFAEMFVRVDNLTDTLVLPQLGLPEAGREVRGGLSVSF